MLQHFSSAVHSCLENTIVFSSLAIAQGNPLAGSIQPAIFCTASMPPCCQRALTPNGKSTPFFIPFQAPASASMSAFTLLSLKRCWTCARNAKRFFYALSNECCCQGKDNKSTSMDTLRPASLALSCRPHANLTSFQRTNCVTGTRLQCILSRANWFVQNHSCHFLGGSGSLISLGTLGHQVGVKPRVLACKVCLVFSLV